MHYYLTIYEAKYRLLEQKYAQKLPIYQFLWTSHAIISNQPHPPFQNWT